MELLEGIHSRRSVREFAAEPMNGDDILEILEAGSWAPSGLNNQPWRFLVVKEKERLRELAGQTTYGHIIAGAPVCIVVCADPAAMYNEKKDHMALGACIQNMLLAAHARGLGAVWLGEILNKSEAVKTILNIPAKMELAAVVALGQPAHRNQSSQRKPLAELMLEV